LAASDPASTLRIICGPTAGGKSRLAFRLSTHADLTIISADSRQIYRGFDIGTAKPSEAERRDVPHRGVDIVEPTERYSAYRWACDAIQWIEESEASGRTPVVVGGTGFYIRALVDPPADWPPLSRRFRARYLVVDPGDVLAHAIRDRVDAMFAEGWEEEIRRLHQSVPEEAPAWLASGYRMLRRAVGGELSIEAAKERIVIETRQYAKRQRTWFRHQPDPAAITRLDPTKEDKLEKALRWWNTNE
jgi:tRNA A37 N6-isopentenylltransferase MiaA